MAMEMEMERRIEMESADNDVGPPPG